MESNETQPAEAAVNSKDQSNPVYRFDGRRFANEVTVTPYDFRRSAALTQAEQRQLECLHQKFAEHLSARLSTFLRLDCSATLSGFETPAYRNFIESLESPAAVALLQVDPLPGVGILNLGLSLSHSIIDRMLGGRGVVTNVERELSEIEVALFDDVVRLIGDEWCQQWRSETRLEPQCIGHETSARFLKTSLADAIVVASRIQIKLGESQGHIQLGIPYSMVETMVKEMQKREAIRGGEHHRNKPQWRPSFNEIAVPVVAQWKVKEMRVQDLISLTPGDVLPLDPDLIARTHVQLANSREFIGSVGIQNGRVAVQLTKHLALS
jgi:flagellar motor switch protein FliM